MLQVRRDELSTFKATLQNSKIAEWFNYKSSGSPLSFEIPSILGDNFVGVAFWVGYHSSFGLNSQVEAVITNKTEGITKNFKFYVFNYVFNTSDDVQTSVQCIRGDDISVKSGDKIEVSFQISRFHLYYLTTYLIIGEIKMCGAHLILKTPSTSTPF